MVVLGAVLIVVGTAMVFFSGEAGRAARLVSFIGAVLAVLGLVLVAIDVLDLDEANAGVLALPLLGMAVPPGRPRRAREAGRAAAVEGDPLPPSKTYARKSKKPTRKLLAAAVTTVALYVISRFTEVDKDTEQLVNVLAPLIVAYVFPNEDTPGGVPLKE